MLVVYCCNVVVEIDGGKLNKGGGVKAFVTIMKHNGPREKVLLFET